MQREKPLRGIPGSFLYCTLGRLSLASSHGKQVDISQALDMYLHVSV